MGWLGTLQREPGQHSLEAQRRRQSADRIEDANLSTQPTQITLAELLRKLARR